MAQDELCSPYDTLPCEKAHGCPGTRKCERRVAYDPDTGTKYFEYQWGECIADAPQVVHSQPQYSFYGCKWRNPRVPVYFNPGTIAANGFSVDAFRNEMLNAMAMWTEEAQSRVDLYSAGDTTSFELANSIVVRHQDAWACSDNVSAKAFWAGSGDCETGSPSAHVYMLMQDSCSPGVRRDWRTGWPGPTFAAFGLGGATGYEHVIGHELGHMLGLPDVPSSGGTMGWQYGHSTWRMIYPIDVNTIRQGYGGPNRFVTTAFTGDGNSFSPASAPMCRRTTVAPGIAGYVTGTSQMRMAISEPNSRVAELVQGNHGGWNWHSSAADAADTHKWVSVATSTRGETVVVWPVNCAAASGCDVRWAWTNNSGSTWTLGTLGDIDTYAKPSVAYDPSGDRFVLAHIDTAESRVHTRSMPAWQPGWSAGNPTGAAPIRYMGGMVFDGADAGLLLVASDLAASKNQILQYALLRNVSNYNTGDASFILANAGAANTRRHFGVARNPSTGAIMVAWRDGGGPRPMAVATKSSMSVAAQFSGPVFHFSNMVNGVDVAFDTVNSRFVTAFTFE